MKRSIFYLCILVLFLISCDNKIKVVCIGDSITNGSGTKVLSISAYPVQLNEELGQNYLVLNCGESGATMQTDGNKPYWNEKDFSNALVFDPDIVVIMLGTNDSKTQNWNAASYERDYQAMIDTLKTLKTKPEIFLCSPPPAYKRAWNISDSTIRVGVIPIVQKLALKNSLEVINVYDNMSSMPELFPDGIHPNENGAAILAKTIAKGISSKE